MFWTQIRCSEEIRTAWILYGPKLDAKTVVNGEEVDKVHLPHNKL